MGTRSRASRAGISRRNLFRTGALAAVGAAADSAQAAPASASGANVYTRIGVRPFINCTATLTINGGSSTLPEVIAAMEQAAHFHVDLNELMEKAGVPAFSIEHATEFAGKPAGWGKQAADEYDSKHYHQPSDEFDPAWDFTALEQAGTYGFILGRDIANR